MIGQGAYGIVYKGRKEDTGQIVAIKRIPFADATPEGGVPCNVIREISLLRELDHPNVVSIKNASVHLSGVIVLPLASDAYLLCIGQVIGHHSGSTKRLVSGLRVRGSRSQDFYGPEPEI